MSDDADRYRDWRRRLLTAMAAWKADPSHVRWQAVEAILDQKIEEGNDD